jgi:hypothetical protein
MKSILLSTKFARGCFWSLALMPVLLGCGCGKKAAPEPVAAAAPVPEVVTTKASPSPVGPPKGHPPETMPTAKLSIAANASATEAAVQMSAELRNYVLYTRTIPKSFEDFVAHHPMRYPAPPAGKRYVIEDGNVVVK